MGPPGQAEKHRLGFVELILRQPNDRRVDTCRALEPLDFEDLPLGFGLGPGREVFADAFAVQPAGHAENDLPGGIREF